jgi:hypothetical protein
MKHHNLLLYIQLFHIIVINFQNSNLKIYLKIKKFKQFRTYSSSIYKKKKNHTLCIASHKTQWRTPWSPTFILKKEALKDLKSPTMLEGNTSKFTICNHMQIHAELWNFSIASN